MLIYVYQIIAGIIGILLSMLIIHLRSRHRIRKIKHIYLNGGILW